MTLSLSRRAIVAGAIGSLALAGTTASAREKITIATSMPILQDIVANIAGDAATVFSVMPANADPHTWEARPEDMTRLAEAKAFIYNGALLEPFIETGGWRRTVRDTGVAEFVVTDHVELIVVDQVIDHGDHTHDLRGGDPHIWLDPMTMVQAVPAIAGFLAELDPDNAETYRANAESYAEQINSTHLELDEMLSKIPDDKRKMLVFHDAWRYFAARYNFEVIGIVLENPNAELSAQKMVELMEIMDKEGVRVIFAEPQFNTSVLDMLVQEGDAEIAMLLTDSFAEGVDSYLGLLKFDGEQLVKYLA